jgi:hypothetical protein
MADISMSIGGNAVSFTVADADAARILAAYSALFTKPGEDGGEPVVPTVQETVVEIGKSVIAGLASNAIRYEQEQAAKAAAEAVPAIDATLKGA